MTTAVGTREAAKQYLASHRIPQMFESLLSCLMMERPEDPVAFIESKMSQIREVGVKNVNWETFVITMHPYRDHVRREYIHDDSKFDRERIAEEQARREAEEAARRKAQEELDEANRTPTPKTPDYESELFQLTEAT